MAKLLNADFWNKAYLLEFKLNGVLTDAFTFSVPPENEEFSFPQRKNETKTFGGAVVADYGNDLVQINLSGSTINQEVKLIYKSRLGSDMMTGEQEIFYLRDLLKKYGSRDKLQNKEVYLYSLSGGGKVTSHNPKWWRIFVGQLDISRSKDKPFCYNYKFTASGAPEVTKKGFALNTDILTSVTSKINGWKENIDGLIEEMNNLADKLEEYGGGFLADLKSYIGTFRSCLDQFNSAIGHYAAVFSGIIDEAGDFAVDTVMLGDKVLYSAFRYYPTIAADVWNSCLNLKASASDIYDYCANLGESYLSEEGNYWKTVFDESSWQSITELYDDSVSDEDIADVFSDLAYAIILDTNKVVVLTSKNLNDIGIAIIPGATGEDDQIIVTYGYKVVAITDSETSWDQLAQDYYGDSSLSYIIATYNNLPTDKPLQPGQSILIPNLNFAESKTSENEVYNNPDVKDNYGKDLMIKDKDLSIYNGDLAVIGGIDNLRQALLNRYSTLIGARIRVEVYGIQASIGDALNATSALIQASVHQTTVEDPRVDSVEDITFKGDGDNLTVSVIYIDKNGAKRNFGGTI